jgi:hypothetical protein
MFFSDDRTYGVPPAGGRLQASEVHRINLTSENGPQPKRSHGLDEAKFSKVAVSSRQTRTQVPQGSTTRGSGNGRSRRGQDDQGAQ